MDSKPTPKRHPVLCSLLASGVVYRNGPTSEYIGIAADGAHVQVGSAHDADGTELFLSHRPTPNLW